MPYVTTTPEPCACIYPDPEGPDDCACGHALDEHDEEGQCQGQNQ